MLRVKTYFRPWHKAQFHSRQGFQDKRQRFTSYRSLLPFGFHSGIEKETLNHDRTCQQSSGLPLGSSAYSAQMPTLHCRPLPQSPRRSCLSQTTAGFIPAAVFELIFDLAIEQNSAKTPDLQVIPANRVS
jgi:hypothetical protein